MVACGAPTKMKQIDAARDVLGDVEILAERVETIVRRVVGGNDTVPPPSASVSAAMGGILGGATLGENVAPPVLHALGNATDRARGSIARIHRLIERLDDSL